MKRPQRGFLTEADFWTLVVFLLAAGIAMGQAFPWLWSLIKPLAQKVTT